MNKMQKLIENDIRYPTFEKAIRFVNYEIIKGDIIEFGVYTGRSLALLSHAYNEFIHKSIHKIPFNRKIIGLDSFNGLVKNEHPRWTKGIFSHNHSKHPTIKVGEKITKEKVENFFNKMNLAKPIILEGLFSNTISNLKNITEKLAIVHIDCDLYEPTLFVLKEIETILQEGTILLFDDWFNFKGNPLKGESGAVKEWLLTSKWKLREWFSYATFCKAFIVIK